MIAGCRQAQTGRLERMYIVGERGIGKSSLAAFVRQVAERDLRMLAAHVHLGGVKSLDEMARRVFKEFAEASRDKPWWKRLQDSFGTRLRSVGIFGATVEFDAPAADLRFLWQNLHSELHGLLARLDDQRHGAMLILDDINGLADSDAFANWIKSFVDSSATSTRSLPLYLVLASTPERRRQLLSQNPSLNRVFDVIETKPLSELESQRFFQDTFATVGVTCDEQTLPFMALYSGGYPALLQEIGDAVFKSIESDSVTLRDAVAGVTNAAASVGRKYIEPEVLAAVRSPSYRSILKHLARTFSRDSFSRKDVLADLPDSQARVFDNFVKRMKHLGVLLSDDPGTYRFANELHRLYYILEAHRAESASAGD